MNKAVHCSVFSVRVMRTAYAQKSKDFKIAVHGGVDGVSAIFVHTQYVSCIQNKHRSGWLAYVTAHIVMPVVL